MKKVWIITIVVLVILSAGGGIYLSQRSSRENTSISTPVVIEPTPTPEELATWEDPNGFQFQYPKSLNVDPHDEDTQNYAHIEFTSPKHPGSVIVWAKDTKAVDADAWVKGDKTFTGAVVLDTTLGEKSGKKILIETPSKKIIAAVVDSGVIFYIDGDLKDSEYWTNVHTTIATTFEFTYNKPALGNSTDETSVDQVVDEEEVIE